MSFGNDTRVRTRKIVDIQGQPKLILTDELIAKISLFHVMVKDNTEWSGVLIYETVTGDYKDPANWEIKATDMILMDVGSAAYTEYEFDEKDTYSFDKYTDAMIEGKNIGHIHTHHSMS